MKKQVFVALKGITDVSEPISEPGKLTSVVTCKALMKPAQKAGKNLPTGKYVESNFKVALMAGEKVVPGIYQSTGTHLYVV